VFETAATYFLAVFVCAIAVGCVNDVPSTPVARSSTGASFTTGIAINTGSKETYTLAVIGDTPYGDAKLAEPPRLIALINADPKVDLVAHLGDIKAGKKDAWAHRGRRSRELGIRREYDVDGSAGRVLSAQHNGQQQRCSVVGSAASC